MLAQTLSRLMSSTFVANSVTQPGKSPVIGSPTDYGMDYEDVTFKAQDDVSLSGWLIRGTSKKLIVVSHFGILCSRSGYTPRGKGLVKGYDKEISFLKTVKHLVDAGYSVLMYDQRNHGNSGPGTCQWITGGVEESKDVLAAVNFITHHSDYQDSSIGLLSFCQGANATTYAYGREHGLAAIANLKALIAIQPMYNNSTFLRAFGFSNNQVAQANQLNLDRGGLNIEQSCWDHVGKINVPTLLLQADDDPWTNLDKVKEYYDLLNVEKQIAWVKCGGKRLATYSHFEHSPELMLEWFRKYV